MEAKCLEGLRQIEEMRYRAGLEAEGFSKMREYAVCFWRKEVVEKKESCM